MSKPFAITGGVAGIAAALAACSSSPPPTAPTPPSPVTGGFVERPRPNGEPATVRFLNVEGGCWVIETASGRFQPTNLPEKFRTDGRKVVVVLRESELGMMSMCQVGPVVELEMIRNP